MLYRNVRVESVTFDAKHYHDSDSLAGLTWLIRLSSLASLVSASCFWTISFNQSLQPEEDSAHLVPVFNEANTKSKQKWKQAVVYQFGFLSSIMEVLQQTKCCPYLSLKIGEGHNLFCSCNWNKTKSLQLTPRLNSGKSVFWAKCYLQYDHSNSGNCLLLCK